MTSSTTSVSRASFPSGSLARSCDQRRLHGDPLAVSLVIGFNVALLGERPGTRTVAPGTGLESEAEADTVARPKGSAWAAGLTLLVLEYFLP